MKLEMLIEKEAEELADQFPEWVSDLLRESASGARETIRWFIKTIYLKGYEVLKKS